MKDYSKLSGIEFKICQWVKEAFEERYRQGNNDFAIVKTEESYQRGYIDGVNQMVKELKVKRQKPIECDDAISRESAKKVKTGQLVVTSHDIGRVIRPTDNGGYISEQVIPKEVFVEAYKKWILEPMLKGMESEE